MLLSQKTFVDVGAGGRAHYEEWLKQKPHLVVYAIEPHPILAEELGRMAEVLSEGHNKRDGKLLIHEFAAIDSNKKTNLYLCNRKSCSSTHPMIKSNVRRWKYPPGSGYFETSAQPATVQGKMLGSFFEDECISRVDFLNVDVQGNCMDVFSGIGSKWHIIKDVKVKVHITDWELYTDQTKKQDVLELLKEKGFVFQGSYKISRGQEEILSFGRPRDWAFPVRKIVTAKPLAKPSGNTAWKSLSKKPPILKTRASIVPVFVESMNLVQPRTSYVQKPHPPPIPVRTSMIKEIPKVIQPRTGYVHKPSTSKTEESTKKTVDVPKVIQPRTRYVHRPSTGVTETPEKIVEQPKVIQPRTGYVQKPKPPSLKDEREHHPVAPKTLPPRTGYVQKPQVVEPHNVEEPKRKKKKLVKRKRKINLDIKEPRMEETLQSNPSRRIIGSSRAAFTVGPKKVLKPLTQTVSVEVPELGDTASVKEVVTSKMNVTPKVIGNPKTFIVPGIVRPRRI